MVVPCLKYTVKVFSYCFTPGGIACVGEMDVSSSLFLATVMAGMRSDKTTQRPYLRPYSGCPTSCTLWYSFLSHVCVDVIFVKGFGRNSGF
ncbi:hypothetical protein BJX96DRAFT_146540 [Aspergillus floccosus]